MNGNTENSILQEILEKVTKLDRIENDVKSLDRKMRDLEKNAQKNSSVTEELKKGIKSLRIEFNTKMDETGEKFDETNTQMKKMESKLGRRIREMEKDVQDISSINGAVRRMGFQEIPNEMQGNAAVEEVKDYY